MGLRFCILASGSTGNAMVVQHDSATLLVDAGLSCKKIEQLMSSQQVKAGELDAVLVTHEHSDHIKGLGALSRKYELPIYANRKTWEAMDKQVGTIAEEHRRVIDTGEMLRFGELKVDPYLISHDAAEPVGYCFYDKGKKLGLATDLGYMSYKVKEKLLDSDVLILESNHDTEMLRAGRYPWNIKRRILGDSGHLSNESAGEALCDLMTGKTRRVYLAHLSRDHNLMGLARLTVNNIIQEHSSGSSKLELKDTYYDRPTGWDGLD